MINPPKLEIPDKSDLIISQFTMSTPSVRRMKENGKTPLSAVSLSGKDSLRSTSRIRASTQKPSVKPIARVDKSATTTTTTTTDPRARWSSSSVPRGRSSSPSDFTRALSDLKKNQFRVSVGPPKKKAVNCNSNEKTGEKHRLDKRVVYDLQKKGEFLSNVEELCEGNVKSEIGILKRSESDKKERNLSVVNIKRHDPEKSITIIDELDGKCCEKQKVRNAYVNSSDDEKVENLCSLCAKRTDLELFDEEVKLKLRSSDVEMDSGLLGSNMVNKIKVSTKGNGGNRYSSRLREKLGFLEGRVNRIASDIKKTKEMLDLNNPDSSKMILSDIQEKISGIEKAMGDVAGSQDSDVVLAKTVEGNEKGAKELIDAKRPSKSLSIEELEARFFPHQKLIRNKTLLKTNASEVEESCSKPNLVIEESSLDDNAITMEFLNALDEKERKVCAESSETRETSDVMSSVAPTKGINIDDLLMSDENLKEFDHQERVPDMIIDDEIEDSCTFQLNDIGNKISTGGWFVSEGESVLLAHDDNSCSFYDIANCEEKSVYRPPAGISPNMWRDCWIIRAPSSDGCSGRYVVASSAGNSKDSGFCSWDFYTKEVRAFHSDNVTSSARKPLAPLPHNTLHRRNSLSKSSTPNEPHQWWSKPCGPLMLSTATCQKTVQIFDIRDGDQVMKWELHKPLVSMDYSSPMHWRNRGKMVLAEFDGLSVWDVSSQSSQPLMSISSSGRKISALNVNNSDAELGGGVRQRITTSEAEGNDGIFSTPDFINVLDFRLPSGISIKIPKVGVNIQSVFSHGDSVYIGCTSLKSTSSKHYSSQFQQFSMRKQKLFSTYTLPESNAPENLTALTQVWGGSDHVMGVCGSGLFVFDSLKDDGGLPSFITNFSSVQNVKERIGPEDMYLPTFDYSGSRVLVISRDRPAMWRYLF